MYKLILASGSPRRKEILEQIGVKFIVNSSDKEEIVTKEKPEDIVVELAFMKVCDIAGKIGGSSVIIGADTMVALNGQVMGKPKNEAEAKSMLLKLQGNRHQVFTGVSVIVKSDKILEAQGEKSEKGVKNTKYFSHPDLKQYPKRRFGYAMGAKVKKETHIFYTFDLKQCLLCKKIRHGMGFKVINFVERTDVWVYPMKEGQIDSYIASGEPFDKAGGYGIQGKFAVNIEKIEGDYYNIVGFPIGKLYTVLLKEGIDILNI